jgi:hypothetical protein
MGKMRRCTIQHFHGVVNQRIFLLRDTDKGTHFKLWSTNCFTIYSSVFEFSDPLHLVRLKLNSKFLFPLATYVDFIQGLLDINGKRNSRKCSAVGLGKAGDVVENELRVVDALEHLERDNSFFRFYNSLSCT